MTIWYKQGVQGDLSNVCRKCLGRIHDQVYNYAGGDMYVTSIRDGNHMAGSLHYNGNAFDFRKLGRTKQEIKHACGKGFDVVQHSTHFHVEYDPKEG
jgi:hypothetical protein